jgi:L-threonylcarbamoyladenylate synthase
MSEIDHAVALLRAGDLVAFPTETVYGLGADARNHDAVAKIFRAKGRPADHPLIVHLPADDHLSEWAQDIPDAAWELAEQFWPGPLTLILKRRPEVPDAVTGGQDTVGLRVPGHPLALELLRRFDGGLAAPSANRFGRISPTTAEHVREEFGASIPLILDGGPCQVGIESTIIDLSRDEPVVLRPGMIGADVLGLVLGRPVSGRGQANETAMPRVSGSLAAHYAPRTALQLVAAAQLPQHIEACRVAGRKPAVLACSLPPIAGLVWLSGSDSALRYGHDLYANLRALDHSGVDLILVEAPPTGSAWTAIHDRLGRAAAGAGR